MMQRPRILCCLVSLFAVHAGPRNPGRFGPMTWSKTDGQSSRSKSESHFFAVEPPAELDDSRQNAQATRIKNALSRMSWWLCPALTMIFAFTTFPVISKFFHRVVLWVSEDSWLPDTPEQMSLLSNVITQVVNGPVVTSISVLFATLASVTISTLHSRQQDVQMSLLNEMEALLNLQSLLSSPMSSKDLNESEKAAFVTAIETLKTVVATESVKESMRPQNFDPHDFVALQSDHILTLCDKIALELHGKPKKIQKVQPVLSKIQSLVESVREERKNRWAAVMSMHFPLAHYLTLGLLVASVLVAFLVTTDEADFIFLQGLQVRMLWSVLVACFSSLAVVCADLSDAYSGAYRMNVVF